MVEPPADAAKSGKPPAHFIIQLIGTPPSSEPLARSKSSRERGFAASKAAVSRSKSSRTLCALIVLLSACSGRLPPLHPSAGRGYVEGWVAVEEARRLEPEGEGVHRHDGPVLRARYVVDAEDVPKYDVGILDAAVLLCPHGEPGVRLALVDELAAWPALVRVVGRDPERVAYDLGPAQHGGGGVEHRGDTGPWHQLVANRVAEAVAHALVDDFPGPLGVPVVVLLALLLGAQRRLPLH